MRDLIKRIIGDVNINKFTSTVRITTTQRRALREDHLARIIPEEISNALGKKVLEEYQKDIRKTEEPGEDSTLYALSLYVFSPDELTRLIQYIRYTLERISN